MNLHNWQLFCCSPLVSLFNHHKRDALWCIKLSSFCPRHWLIHWQPLDRIAWVSSRLIHLAQVYLIPWIRIEYVLVAMRKQVNAVFGNGIFQHPVVIFGSGIGPRSWGLGGLPGLLPLETSGHGSKLVTPEMVFEMFWRWALLTPGQNRGIFISTHTGPDQWTIWSQSYRCRFLHCTSIVGVDSPAKCGVRVWIKIGHQELDGSQNGNTSMWNQRLFCGSYLPCDP